MTRFDFDGAAIALEARDEAALVAALAQVSGGDADDPQLRAWVRFALDPRRAPPRWTKKTRPFIDSVRQIRRDESGNLRPRIEPPHFVLGQDLDFLGGPGDVNSWLPIQYLNRLLLERIRPNRTAAVVGTMRDDGIYAIEWIAHYRALGFEHVFIYTNDNADGSEQLLRCLAKHGVITLIESETAGKVPPEIKAFEHSLHLLHSVRDFEWLLFVDSDEFLMPADRFAGSITTLIAELTESRATPVPSAVLYEWMWYVSGMVFRREPGMLAERFQHTRAHWLTKALVRVADTISMRPQHHPELKPGRQTLNSAFKPFDLDMVWEARRPPCYDGGWIAHYWPKSFEEFSLKKARGDALKLKENGYSRDFSLFFLWNGEPTPETQRRPDPHLMSRVKAEAERLRGLDGVTAAEGEVERRFQLLLSRFDVAGGLDLLYDRSRQDPKPF